jgi:hypothetical protein
LCRPAAATVSCTSTRTSPVSNTVRSTRMTGTPWGSSAAASCSVASGWSGHRTSGRAGGAPARPGLRSPRAPRPGSRGPARSGFPAPAWPGNSCRTRRPARRRPATPEPRARISGPPAHRRPVVSGRSYARLPAVPVRELLDRLTIRGLEILATRIRHWDQRSLLHLGVIDAQDRRHLFLELEVDLRPG